MRVTKVDNLFVIPYRSIGGKSISVALESTTQFLELVTILACETIAAITSSPLTKLVLGGFPLFPVFTLFLDWGA